MLLVWQSGKFPSYMLRTWRNCANMIIVLCFRSLWAHSSRQYSESTWNGQVVKYIEAKLGIGVPGVSYLVRSLNNLHPVRQSIGSESAHGGGCGLDGSHQTPKTGPFHCSFFFATLKCRYIIVLLVCSSGSSTSHNSSKFQTEQLLHSNCSVYYRL